ncbi:MAG: hypothetical protein FWG66_03790 [Spirochaetes bacterium]|nr:hypothetical protein [Spirochaetota bacterium]
MNSLEKEYIYFRSKCVSDEYLADEIKAIQESGGIISFKDDVTDLIYTCADGDECYIDVYPRLYKVLVALGEIEKVKLTEAELAEAEKTGGMSVPDSFFQEEIDRVLEYVKRKRRDIAEGLIVVETPGLEREREPSLTPALAAGQ